MFHFSKYKLLFIYFKQTILISSLHFMNIHTQQVLFTGLANYSMWCQYVYVIMKGIAAVCHTTCFAGRSSTKQMSNNE